VDEKTADEDAESYDCDGCPVAAALDGLDPFNQRVWALYEQVVTRLAADLHAGSAVLERLTREMSADEFDDVWRRLVLLYNTIQPPPKPPGESGE
jgi:hypothetical protein